MKIYIVSFQWKEDNETECVSLGKESSGGDGVGTTGVMGQHARRLVGAE